ncbi:4'-phosphopantetheinyl transferase family protein [Mucilaginibacter phyllosphaerae]|uniref:4'-phosphopantetheinyl transferase n=1 Tax=Mucilaginibacter phyllosphaerae TaxID=1812349 RepID=A0ABR6I8T0_9SPHI|nr:4'-phosphopantetheinyl transferase superfamily protein [Mucilaginibacter phyllosphaerae]MBB3969450.1 4'-phosphopantetheinyl transferase [Mucilaginibacter phyllosphaerae]
MPAYCRNAWIKSIINRALGVIINRQLNDITWQTVLPDMFVTRNNEVHIWRVCISQNLKRLERFEALLTADETVRAGKYRQQKDTYRFIVSRGMQRIILGRYVNTPPAQLKFILGENKKPCLMSQDGNTIHYNVSHAGDWIVLAVATLPVGADVEYADAAFSFQEILADNFSREEVAYINQDNAAHRFYTLWTRKEAILKATGQGIGEHLSITPALNGTHLLNASLTGADKNWQLRSFNLYPQYASTVVVEDAGQDYLFFDTASF